MPQFYGLILFKVELKWRSIPTNQMHVSLGLLLTVSVVPFPELSLSINSSLKQLGYPFCLPLVQKNLNLGDLRILLASLSQLHLVNFSILLLILCFSLYLCKNSLKVEVIGHSLGRLLIFLVFFFFSLCSESFNFVCCKDHKRLFVTLCLFRFFQNSLTHFPLRWYWASRR